MLNLLVAIALASQGGDGPPTYTPSQTLVAILPVLNTSGEKWKQLRTRQEEAAAKWLRESFEKRGFNVVKSEAVAEAIKTTALDFSDEETLSKANILAVGAALKADVVELTVVTDTRQDGSGFGQTGYGVVQLKSWLLDVKSGRPIFSAKSASARSARASAKTSDRQVWAVALALTDTFKDFFASYPEIKK